MDNNITVNGNTYLLTAPSGVGGSMRLDASTGLNTPVTLSIRQVSYQEPKTRLPGHLSSVRISIPVPVKGGTEMQELSYTFTGRVPKDASLDWTTDVAPMLTRIVEILSTTALTDDVFKSRLS